MRKRRRDLSAKARQFYRIRLGRSKTTHIFRYVYLWADGIHFNIRLEDPGNNKQCILVLMPATGDGKKELIAISDGYRESGQSWRELLLDIKERGLIPICMPFSCSV